MALKTSDNFKNNTKRNQNTASGSGQNNELSQEKKDCTKKIKGGKRKIFQRWNTSNEHQQNTRFLLPTPLDTSMYRRCYPQNLQPMPRGYDGSVAVRPSWPYYPQYLPYQTYSPITRDWNPAMQVPNYMFNPVQTRPVVIPPYLTSQVCPYTSGMCLQPFLPDPVVPIIASRSRAASLNSSFESVGFNHAMPPSSDDCNSSNILNTTLDSSKERAVSESKTVVDPLELYLTLPKDIFPSPRMIKVDPNPIIDAFCRIGNVQKETPWILDLEFGVPRVPVMRPIATYDVQLNCVNCKNSPGAIHPGFERCSDDFKRLFLFHYECIISSWYKGYMIMYCDRSRARFQAWLMLPMQVFGMCWP